MASRPRDYTNLTHFALDPADRLDLLVVVGSTREGRLGPDVGRWFAQRARQREELEVRVLDLAVARVPETLTNDPPTALEPVTRELDSADAFVLVTPEYNHSFPAPLKSLIDWHSTEWRAKPVGFVSYGGRSGGIRAVEQLRQVFAELHAVTVRDAVSLVDIWNHVEEGRIREPAGSADAAQAMLDQLTWWGRVLRGARHAEPYLP